MKLDELATPCLLLERPVLARNLARMKERAAALGVALRPHLKTAKCAEVAKRADAGGGFTVATLAEAEYFAAAGFRDLTCAVGMLPARLPRAAQLLRAGVRLRLLCDEPATAAALGRGAAALGVRFEVLIEIDCGGRRGGVPAGSPALLEIAEALEASGGSSCAGVLTHAGHAYYAEDLAALRRIAEEERDALVEAAGRLRAAGLPCPVRSVGSTPTALCAEHLEGITEMRPGVYMFCDLDQERRGVCRREDLALSVLARVLGHNLQAGRLLLDAGALALSKDHGGAEVGYGLLCEARSMTPLGLRVAAVEQEHGIVEVSAPEVFQRLPIGSLVRVLPHHACLTAAAYGTYRVVEGEEVVARWEKQRGW